MAKSGRKRRRIGGIREEMNVKNEEIEYGVTEIKREGNRDTYVLRLTYC